MLIKHSTAALRLTTNQMVSPPPNSGYIHYTHTDSCTLSRWTAKESYEFMYSKPWKKVNDFYLNMVNNNSIHNSLSLLFPKQECDVVVNDDGGGGGNVEDLDGSETVRKQRDKDKRTGRWARANFKIVVSYHGGSFDGWQKQPGLNTVQGLIETCLGKFVDERKVQLLKEKKLPIDGCVLVAGRTDKGVTALEQVCSFYTWRTDIKVKEIEDSVNSAAPGKIKVISVSQVSRDFHPNFSAKWRHYFYIFPLNGEIIGDESNQCIKTIENDSSDTQGDKYQESLVAGKGGHILDDDDKNEEEVGEKPSSFKITDVNRLLQQLEGKLLSYRMFARDLKASRNVGPPTECFVYHARAAEADLSCSKDGTTTKIMCIELVANRFLRKMVRVLVATAIREAAAGADEDALIKLMDATCRRATAPPAPADGLCLVDVGYTDFDRKRCIIR